MRFLLSILLLSPLLGEFGRIELFGRSIILTDLLVIFFLILYLSLSPRGRGAGVRKNPSPTILIFILISIFSFLLSAYQYSFSEIFPGALYLIRLIAYLSLFPILIKISPSPLAGEGSRVRGLFSPSPLEGEESRVRGNFNTLPIILFTTFLLSILGFIQLYFLPDLEPQFYQLGYDPHKNRLVSTWLDPNLLGGLLAFMLSFFICLFLFKQKPVKSKPIALIVLITIAAALFLTYSRSAYLAAATSLFLIGAFKSPRLLIITILTASLAITVSPRAQERLGEFMNSINSSINPSSIDLPDPTARLRIQNYEDTLRLIEQKPLFGHGYNNLALVKYNQAMIMNTNIHSASGSDSSLLTILATTGILGLIPFIIFLGQILIQSWNSFKHSKKVQQQALGLALFTSTSGLLIHSLFVNSLLFSPILLFFITLSALFYSDSF